MLETYKSPMTCFWIWNNLSCWEKLNSINIVPNVGLLIDSIKSVFGIFLRKYWDSRVVTIIIFAPLIEFYKMEYDLGCWNEILFFLIFLYSKMTKNDQILKFHFNNPRFCIFKMQLKNAFKIHLIAF